MAKNIIPQMEKKNPSLFNCNNKVVVFGKIEENFQYNHREKGTRLTYYRTRVISPRETGKQELDFVPILIPDTIKKEIVDEYPSVKNKWIAVAGVLKTYRDDAKDGHRYLSLHVVAREIHIYESQDDMGPQENMVYLDGYLWKDACSISCFKTDFSIAVARNHTKADYIPCIGWGKAKEPASKLRVGQHVSFYGRFQSKTYKKQISPGVFQERVAYEIATKKIRLIG